MIRQSHKMIIRVPTPRKLNKLTYDDDGGGGGGKRERKRARNLLKFCSKKCLLVENLH